jgi:ABC-type nitrate/sulfonate/bicarbonate transport system substrate-binding protein
MPNEITAGRAAMPDAEISQEAARAMLAALREAASYIENHQETYEVGAEIAREARAAIALAERGA